MQTVLATFDDPQIAQSAVDQLLDQGFSRGSVHLQAGTGAGESAMPAEGSMMSSVGHFFSHLFGKDDSTTAGTYSEVVRRGSTVVAVDASTDTEVETAHDVMQRLGTINVDDRAAEWKRKGWTGFDPQSAPLTDAEVDAERVAVPVVQEDVAVGKRTVNVGGLRVIKRISETPVSQIISLRQEKATVDRKPVDRPATETDFQNFKEGTFEVRESAEEAVIGKSARVVEEVSIGRSVTDRSETVSDTVRRTDVDVERIPGDTVASTHEVIRKP